MASAREEAEDLTRCVIEAGALVLQELVKEEIERRKQRREGREERGEDEERDG